MGFRMGTPPAVPPVAAGDLCPFCWGPGKTFGPEGTPESIIVNFSGIEKGPDWIPALGEPIDGTFEVTQDLVLPCKFTGPGVGGSGISLTFGVGVTSMTAETSLGNTCFVRAAAACRTVVGNEGVFTLFIGGTATIIIPEVT